MTLKSELVGLSRWIGAVSDEVSGAIPSGEQEDLKDDLVAIRTRVDEMVKGEEIREELERHLDEYLGESAHEGTEVSLDDFVLYLTVVLEEYLGRRGTE